MSDADLIQRLRASTIDADDAAMADLQVEHLRMIRVERRRFAREIARIARLPLVAAAIAVAIGLWGGN